MKSPNSHPGNSGAQLLPEPSPDPSISLLQSQKTIPELFASSKHKTASKGSSPFKRQKLNHSVDGGKNDEVAGSTLIRKPEEMYTFTSTPPRRNGIVDLTGSPDPEITPKKNANALRRPSITTPHNGTKRLVVKNFRKTSRASPDRYYNTVWNQLDGALSKIFRDGKVPLEELYKGVENVCRQDKAAALFQQLRERCKNYVHNDLRAPLLEARSLGVVPVDILRATLKAWTTWKSHLETIRRIFYYMDRSYLLQSTTQPTIEEMGKDQFRSIVFADPLLKPMIIQGACDMVTADRKGNKLGIAFEGERLREAVDMFRTLCVYTREFEPILLGQSQAFFVEWAQEQIETLSLSQYVDACHNLITREIQRCRTFGLENTTEKDILIQSDRFLILDQESILSRTQDVTVLMALDDLRSLSQLFRLLEHKSLGEKLRPPFEVYINQEGSKIVFDEERESEMVVRLLQLKRKLDKMWEDSFMKHEGLGHSLREAFENFINKTKKGNAWGTDNPKPGEMIAKYVDMILRGGVKAIPPVPAEAPTKNKEADDDDTEDDLQDEDLQINRQLDQVLDLFRFVHGKAVFEAFYKKDLARRLLMGRSASAEAEKNMLERLKTECGSGFTHNLEQMFKDIELTRDEMGSYKQMLHDRQKKMPFDFNVNVLSVSAWPTYPDVTMEVPVQVQKATVDFEQSYKAKHSGRKLTWKHALAHCQLRANFPKGNKEIVVSSFQAIVLLYFNEKDAEEQIGYKELKAATRLSDEELKRTLQSLACAKYRVLAKTPKSKDVDDTDTFSINLKFSDPKYRIKINQVQLKETKAENKETHERVAADRHYETQAAIVRILKARKSIKHAELVAEVLQATKSRGALDPADIKKNIEKLLEKDYMEREEGKNSYRYLA